jgi:hypothetical protein
MILHGGAQSSLRPDTVRDNRCDYEAHEGRMQTGRRTAHAGSGLKPLTIGIIRSDPTRPIGLEPCVAREGTGEASVGEQARRRIRVTRLLQPN